MPSPPRTPRTKDTAHRHSEATAPAPRRKTRPKFELPVEPEAVVHDVGWVYRAPEAAVREESTAAVAAPSLPAVTKENRTASGFVVMAGVGVFAVGIVTAGVMSLAAFCVVTMPVRMARRFLASR